MGFDDFGLRRWYLSIAYLDDKVQVRHTATIAQSSKHTGSLSGSNLDIGLTDRHVQCVTGIPFFVIDTLFPGGVRDQTF